jgi:hypothetical protein
MFEDEMNQDYVKFKVMLKGEEMKLYACSKECGCALARTASNVGKIPNYFISKHHKESDTHQATTLEQLEQEEVSNDYDYCVTYSNNVTTENITSVVLDTYEGHSLDYVKNIWNSLPLHDPLPHSTCYTHGTKLVLINLFFKYKQRMYFESKNPASYSKFLEEYKQFFKQNPSYENLKYTVTDGSESQQNFGWLIENLKDYQRFESDPRKLRASLLDNTFWVNNNLAYWCEWTFPTSSFSGLVEFYQQKIKKNQETLEKFL